MKRMKSTTTWLDANGIEHDIQTMADNHVINCILLCKRKIKALESSNEDNMFYKPIQEWNQYVDVFKVELRRRRDLNIVIDREEDDWDMHEDD